MLYYSASKTNIEDVPIKKIVHKLLAFQKVHRKEFDIRKHLAGFK